MIKLEQISLPINYSKHDLSVACAKKLNLAEKDIVSVKILKQSIDSRKKPNIKFIVSVSVTLTNNLEDRFPKLKYTPKEYKLNYNKLSSNDNFVVVGFGPSGMFSALCLAKMGLKPIIIEQGKQIDEREIDVNNFWNNRILNPYSNVQFGEGGAGTFSDGKLNSNLDNDYCKVIINELYSFGAPEEITYTNKPHIGSDKLKIVVKNIREHIISLGGTFLFNTKLIDFGVTDNTIDNITVQNVVDNSITTIQSHHVLLCVGHSARSVFNLLYNKGINIIQKPFAMGVRIEQKQSDINFSQYGVEHPTGLPNADYKLVEHLPNGRSVFTFCMCPGGEVVASSTNDDEIVTNGMSMFARDKENANSAVLVNITPNDFESNHPLAGLDYQAKYERKAFQIGGSNFNAPVQTVGEFLYNTKSTSIINCTYKPNVTYADIKQCLPEIVSDSLKLALPLFNKKLKNFAKNENLLIAIESRTSCPLQIVRDESFQTNICGIYPVGEGAGYSGGIISSAQDGIKVATSIYNSIKNN